MVQPLTNQGATYGKQGATAVVVSAIWIGAWVVSDIFGAQPWLLLFPVLGRLTFRWQLTGAAIVLLVLIVLTIYAAAPNDRRTEFIQQ